MTGQYPLPLGWKAAEGQKDFLVSAANREAVRFLDSWATWPIPVALLIGPPGSGKTHLGRIFARRANARLMDDADRGGSEEGLFHAWNEAVEARRPMLMTARSMPEDWNLSLPDLASRLAATPRVRIGAPDDALLVHLFHKLWRDRGIEVTEELARYVLSRVERSFEGVARAVDLLNSASLARQRPPSIPLAREALLDLVLKGEEPSPPAQDRA